MSETMASAAARPNGAGSQVIQVEPAQVAAMTLEFLARATLTPAERQRFAICEQFLLAIQQGQVQVSGPQEKPAPPDPSPAGGTLGE